MRFMVILTGLACVALLAFQSTAQEHADTPAPAVIQTAAGAFTELGTNERGFREFRREADGATMVLVPGGEFRKRKYVGDPLAGDESYWMDVPAFLIDKYEVTNEQVRDFLLSREDLEFKDDEIRADGKLLVKNHKWGLGVGEGEYAAREGLRNHPSVGTTGHLALAYAKWAGGDLPYGYEFEKAAAGKSGQLFPWGRRQPDRELANFYLYGPRRTQEVGSYPAGVSPYGVHDMAGNVYDRCYWFESPNDIKPDAVPDMIKGGSWVSPHWANLRCIDRCAQPLGVAEGSVGFRCVIRDAEVLKALGARQAGPTLRMHDDIDEAFKEAADRNVPIFLFLSYETCGQCDRVRAQVFGDAEFVEYMNENAVVLIGSDPGDGWQDPADREDLSILFPGCRTDRMRAVFAAFCREVNTREVPKAIYRFRISPGQFALNPHRDLHHEPEDMILQPENAFPKSGHDARTFIDKMKEAQRALGTGLTRLQYIEGKESPETEWKPDLDE